MKPVPCFTTDYTKSRGGLPVAKQRPNAEITNTTKAKIQNPMKTNCSPIPPVASDVRKRTRESIHQPPPVWCPAFRLSSGAQHAKAWTPNALRRFALHAL